MLRFTDNRTAQKLCAITFLTTFLKLFPMYGIRPAAMRCPRPRYCAVGLVAVVLLLHTVGSTAASPSIRLLEEVTNKAEQDAAAPVGRPDSQAQALSAFAAGLSADPYGVMPLWTGESHPCGDASNNFKAWPGITCDAPGGYVTAIRLRGKGLKGLLPSSISVLKSLRILDLSNNSFDGPLPSNWSNLTSLEQCDLSNNHLTGSLLETWASWSAMQTLTMHHNRLSGPLPAAWASMNLLEVLDLSYNELTSTLPPAWAQLGYLSVLNLAHNHLDGTLPPAWAQQRQLLQLNIGSNRIEGVLPPQWAEGMDSLRSVRATGNSLEGSLPIEWSNMTQLQSLSVDHNQLTGSIPDSWSKLHNLYVVNVTSNEGLCGGVPDGVAGSLLDHNTTNLNTHCPWTDDASLLIAFKAGLFDPLQSLNTWRQDSNPCGLQPWAGLVCDHGWVVAIRLQDRGLTGTLSPNLTHLSHLVEIRLADNQLTGTLPDGWCAAPSESLTTIDLSNNTLEGSLPLSWSNLTSLMHLDLSDNQFSGELPTAWGQLLNLATLLLSNNRGLNGTLPAAWSSLSSLKTVHLDEGNITGQLPPSWGKLSKLQDVSLSNNALTGTVPAKLAKSVYLLDLSRNQLLCGKAPDTNGTLVTTRTSLGQECSTIGNSARLSGRMGFLIGALLGVVGSALLAGTAYLVVQRRALRAQQHNQHRVDRPLHNGSRNSPTPSRHTSLSPMKVVRPGSPVPSVVKSGASSPTLSAGTLGASSPKPGSPQMLPLVPHLFVQNLTTTSGAMPTGRPMSPLSLAASADRRGILKHSSSATDLSSVDGCQLNGDAAAVSASCASQLVIARSVSFGSTAATVAAQPDASTHNELAETAPSCPRTTDFDGMVACSTQLSSSRPSSPAGLKLHVATVLKAASAAAMQPPAATSAAAVSPGLVLRPHSNGGGCTQDTSPVNSTAVPSFTSKLPGLLPPAVDAVNESPAESPRGCAVLGVAAAAHVPLPCDGCDSDTAEV